MTTSIDATIAASIASPMTGAEFNERYKGEEFYRIMNSKGKHNNFKYVHGLNIDTEPFLNTMDTKGGLHFTEMSEMIFWIHLGEYICKVTVPNDAQVCIGANEFKSDRLVVDWNAKVLLRDLKVKPQDVKKNGLLLYWFPEKDQTDEICKAAVQQNGQALQYVCNQTADICEAAVKQNGLALKHVKNQNEVICVRAVQQNPKAVRYARRRYTDACIMAVTAETAVKTAVKAAVKAATTFVAA